MTNKEKWAAITDDFCSPQSYIDWGMRFIIAAALQRRVWYGPEHMQCFPNMYGVLFGPPGIGKSLVLDLVSDILRSPKKKDVRLSTTRSDNTEAEKHVIKVTEDENTKIAGEAMIKSKIGGGIDEPPLFISAPDAITYEALVETLGKSLRRINYNKFGPDGQPKLGIYTHCSTFFCLDELGSLFRKKTESVINLLLTLHGCPKFYEYKTKNAGEDRIMNGCLNFLAGTTSDFMEEIAKDKLIGKGFTARCFFICANKKRKHVAAGRLMTPEQMQYKLDLISHIKKLYPLYGQVQVSPETSKWLEDWWLTTEDKRELRPNKSSRLDDYYPIPSLSEISAGEGGLSEHKGLLAYNAIAAMQYSGFGGLLSQITKYPFDFAYKNTPQGATFPLDEVSSDMAETLHYVSEAIANDPNVNWVDLAQAVTMHVLSTNFQLGRIAINQSINNGLITGLPAEKKELSDKMQQLRRFDMVEGLPYNDIDQGSNPYMNLSQKEFKSTQDLSKAVQMLPGLISNIIKTYGDRPDVMLSKLKALKENQYETFPSLEQMPMQAFKYIGYLNHLEGPQAAQEELMGYMKHKVVNEAKASMVP